MKIEHYTITTFGGYNSILKDMYKDGRLPSVKVGLYGGRLSKQTVSLEHIKPASKGGSTALKNMALATKDNNRLRGNRDINNYLTKAMLYNYLIQFKDLIIKYKGKIFNGNNYITNIVSTLKKVGFEGLWYN